MEQRLSTSGGAPVAGSALGLALVAVIVAVLEPFSTHITRATPALVLVLAVVAAGLVGGARAAVVTGVVAATAFNLAFIPPHWTFKVKVWDDWVALGVFVGVALAIGVLTAAQADRRRAAEQREAEMRALYEQLTTIGEERERLLEESARVQLLERVDEQRAALLRSVSHDLRTPLATITGAAGALLASESTLDPALQQAYRRNHLAPALT